MGKEPQTLSFSVNTRSQTIANKELLAESVFDPVETPNLPTSSHLDDQLEKEPQFLQTSVNEKKKSIVEEEFPDDIVCRNVRPCWTLGLGDRKRSNAFRIKRGRH